MPTSADNVFINGSSGSGKITVSGTRSCKQFNNTGGSALEVDTTSGKITPADNLTLDGSSNITASGLGFAMTGAGSTISANGAAVPNLDISGGSGTYFLGTGALVVTGTLDYSHLTLNNNDRNITAGTLTGANASGSSLVVTSGTVTVTASFDPGSSGSVSFDSSATLKFTGSTGTFAGRGQTYGAIQFHGGGSSVFTITGSNTFDSITADVGGDTLKFTNGTTQTTATASFTGSAGHLVQLISSSGGSQWTLDVSGSITADYCNVQDSVGTGATPFTATHSTDGGNNIGWSFGGLPFFGSVGLFF